MCVATSGNRYVYMTTTAMNTYIEAMIGADPSKFLLALQSFCCRLSVVLPSYDIRLTLIRRDRTKQFGRGGRGKEECGQSVVTSAGIGQRTVFI